MMNFSKLLTLWYLANKRDLPWRKTKDPYSIWLSEIMLQQTRIEQGLGYYLKFINAFPTVFDLAEAQEQEVLKLWQGLGYYSRARNLHHTAKEIAGKHKGKFPETRKELLQLKGVGDYTASAVASICFDEPAAVVDGNVYRVLSRVFGIETPINSTKGIREFKQLAQEVMDTENPGTYNQAVMEFGAVHCKPKNPKCGECIFNTSCYALAHNKVDKLPVKTSKTKISNRYFNYLVVVSDDENTILRKRTGNGIWKNLYEFPLVETPDNVFLSEGDIKEEIPDIVIASFSLYNEDPFVHKLSHQHLFIRFWIVKTPEARKEKTSLSEIIRFPVPVPIQNFMKDFFF